MYVTGQSLDLVLNPGIARSFADGTVEVSFPVGSSKVSAVASEGAPVRFRRHSQKRDRELWN